MYPMFISLVVCIPYHMTIHMPASAEHHACVMHGSLLTPEDRNEFHYNSLLDHHSYNFGIIKPQLIEPNIVRFMPLGL